MRTETAIYLIFFAVVIVFWMLKFAIAAVRERGYIHEGDQLQAEGKWLEAITVYKKAVDIGIGGRSGVRAFDKIVTLLRAQGYEVSGLSAEYGRVANQAMIILKTKGRKSGWIRAKGWLFPMASTVDDFKELGAAQQKIKDILRDFWAKLDGFWLDSRQEQTAVDPPREERQRTVRGIIKCPACGARVLSKPDGSCPACQYPIERTG